MGVFVWLLLWLFLYFFCFLILIFEGIIDEEDFFCCVCFWWCFYFCVCWLWYYVGVVCGGIGCFDFDECGLYG